MSILPIVGPKYTPAASNAAPWCVTVSMPMGQTDRWTDGRTSDCYIRLSAMEAASVTTYRHKQITVAPSLHDFSILCWQ